MCMNKRFSVCFPFGWFQSLRAMAFDIAFSFALVLREKSHRLLHPALAGRRVSGALWRPLCSRPLSSVPGGVWDQCPVVLGPSSLSTLPSRSPRGPAQTGVGCRRARLPPRQTPAGVRCACLVSPGLFSPSPGGPRSPHEEGPVCPGCQDGPRCLCVCCVADSHSVHVILCFPRYSGLTY